MDIGQILGNLGFDWRVALANLVNFLVIIWILRKFAFKPLQEAVKNREEKIKQGVEDAVRASTELQMAKQESSRAITEAKNNANEIIATAQKESDKILSESKVAQQEKAKQIIQEAKNIIKQEKQKTMESLKNEVAELVIVTSEKFMKEELSRNKKAEITKKIIKVEK